MNEVAGLDFLVIGGKIRRGRLGERTNLLLLEREIRLESDFEKRKKCLVSL